MKQNKLYIITGTSAVGKTSVALGLLKKTSTKGGSASGRKNLKRSLTFTTRDIRKGEKNNKDYHFISVPEFKQKIKKGEFLEWANNYGNLYGTNKKNIKEILASGKNALVVIDIKGALNIKKSWAKAVIFFILPESFDQLEKRFKKRKDTTAEQIKKRLTVAKWELTKAKKCDYQIINKENKLALTIKEVQKIIDN